MQEGIFWAKGLGFIAVALTMGIGGIGPALGQGFIGGKACENLGKYPQSAGQIRTTMILAMVIVESVAIYSLLIAGALLYLLW